MLEWYACLTHIDGMFIFNVFQWFCNFNANRPFLWFALLYGTWTVFYKSFWHVFQLDKRSYSSWMRELIESWKPKHIGENASQRTQCEWCWSQYTIATGLILLLGVMNSECCSFLIPIFSEQWSAWVKVIKRKHKIEGAWNRISWANPYMYMQKNEIIYVVAGTICIFVWRILYNVTRRDLFDVGLKSWQSMGAGWL